MVTRGVVLATILVSNWIISIPQVVTANVTPQVELMMHHVVEHVDTLVANGDITTPKQFFQELQTRKETISHPYARYIVRSLEKDMQERYAFLQEKTQVAKGSFV